MSSLLSRTILVFSFILGLAAIGLSQSAGAPRIYDVEFRNGVFVHEGVVYPHGPCAKGGPTGVCGNGNSTGFSLTGRAGDRITVTVRSAKGRAVFSIFHRNYEVFQGGSAVTMWSGKLPASGSFRINVFTNVRYTPFTLIITKDQKER